MLTLQLYPLNDDHRIKDKLSFLIARHTMHQQQWLAVIADLGGIEAAMPVLNLTPESHEAMEQSSYVLNTSVDKATSQGKRMDGSPTMEGHSTCSARANADPEGQVPDPWIPREKSGAHTQQMRNDRQTGN